ncbi:MAG: hypothetical protein P4L51_11110 [Puia sp.]|nr:hypothetical protein [Puia sp.]
MQILVKHKMIQLVYSYDVIVDDEPGFQAVKKYFQFFTTFLLRDIHTLETVFTIKRQVSFFKPVYNLYRGNEAIVFRRLTFFYGHHQCKVSGDVYDIYANFEFRFSIFKNGTQVAWIARKNDSLLVGYNYEITADSDCDAPLLAVFCLLIDYTVFRSVGGRCLLETSDICEKDFDFGWLPK